MRPFRRAAMIAFFLALPLAAAAFLSTALTARADESTPSCVTADDLATIPAAQAQGFAQELAARRILLAKIIICAKTEAQTLQSNLNALSESGVGAAIQSQLSGRLGDAMNYYNLELAKVATAGTAGTQVIAREVLDWRQANYEPLAAQVANFTLWAGNQPVFTTARNRLQQMQGIVNFLEQAAPNNELQSDLSNAQALVQQANDENQGAMNALLQALPSDQSLALVQQSLQSLSGAYQKFFDISTIVQSLLSAPKEQ